MPNLAIIPNSGAVLAPLTGIEVSAGRLSLMLAICVFAALQLLMPLRHWLYPGNPNWTEEGHRFAWHMKLRDKDATAVFELRDPHEYPLNHSK